MSIKFISPKKSVNSATFEFPAVKNHLLSFGIEKLEQTGAKYIVKGEEIKARKKISNKWFETQDQIGYYKKFAKPKIMYPNMTSVFPFTYDETGSFGNANLLSLQKKQPSLRVKRSNPKANRLPRNTSQHPRLSTLRHH